VSGLKETKCLADAAHSVLGLMRDSAAVMAQVPSDRFAERADVRSNGGACFMKSPSQCSALAGAQSGL
jgi:hypothetical protein